VNLILGRDGEKKTLYLTVGKRKEQQRRIFSRMQRIPNIPAFSNDHILGLQLFALNEQLGEYFGVPNNEGVLVEEVEQKSAAEKAGFKAGDIIIRVGKKTVDAVEKIQRELQKYEEGDVVEFEVVRKGSNRVLKVELEEQQSIRKNFFFSKPHFQMFRSDLFDDVDIPLDINDLQINLDQLQKEIEKSTRNFKGWNNAI
jgi:predicted metalloprotease with PDZ domain